MGHEGFGIGPKPPSREAMPQMATDKLTDVAIRNAKPGAKAVRLTDGGGLYLEVAPTGGKLWRLKFRFGGKEKRLGVGTSRRNRSCIRCGASRHAGSLKRRTGRSKLAGRCSALVDILQARPLRSVPT